MVQDLNTVLDSYNWVIKTGEDQLKGSSADIYAELSTEDQKFYLLIDDGMVNNFGETIHIYSLDDNGKSLKIFEGICENFLELKIVFKALSFDIKEGCEDTYAVITDSDFNYLTNRNAWLSYLEAAGVDNWEGYDIAYDIAKEDNPEFERP